MTHSVPHSGLAWCSLANNCISHIPVVSIRANTVLYRVVVQLGRELARVASALYCGEGVRSESWSYRGVASDDNIGISVATLGGNQRRARGIKGGRRAASPLSAPGCGSRQQLNSTET